MGGKGVLFPLHPVPGLLVPRCMHIEGSTKRMSILWSFELDWGGGGTVMVVSSELLPCPVIQHDAAAKAENESSGGKKKRRNAA